MKKILAAFALAGLVSGTAAADSNFGVKMGQFSIDGDTTAATQVGFVYTWDLVGVLGIEGELNTSLTKGEFGPVEYGITQAGAYGVVMTPGPFYFKGKAGYLYTDVDIAGVDAAAEAAIGVGVGFELVGFVWEVEYTQTEVQGADASFISVGFKF